MTLTEFSNRVKQSVPIADKLTGAVEALVLAVTTRAAGWVACVPTIALTSRSIGQVFDLSTGAALASAIALELVGQSVVNTWLRAKEWNRGKLQTDASANERLALAMTVAYFATDFVLVGILQIPKATVNPVHWAALLFPLAQVISTVMTAERAAQFRREAEAETEAAKRSAKRKAAQRHKTAQATERAELETAQAELNGTQRQALEILTATPGISGTELGRQLGKSERLGRMLKTRLAPIVSDNGNGRLEVD